jgi:hypothetical protein
MRHRNGTLQDRNIFVANRQIITVVCYHKLQSQWDKPKVVPRFLPPQLRQVIAIYLVYIQPFRKYLTLQVLQSNYTDCGLMHRVRRRQTSLQGCSGERQQKGLG